MARFSASGIDGMLSDLNAMEMERIAPVMLEEATPILERAVKQKASAHRESGAMVNSIKPTKVKRGRDGYSITVRPTGTDENGIRNMEKAAYLEFGNHRYQRATPFLSPAVRETGDAVERKMQEVFDRETQ